MLHLACRLSDPELAAVADLERRVVTADGGRLKLEWGSLRSRTGDEVQDLLWCDGGQVLGFLGLYTFGPALELTGMVAPEARRRGIGGALLDAGLRVAAGRGLAGGLLVVPRSSSAGRALALSRDGQLEHSEHALVLRATPAEGPQDPAVELRQAVAADGAAVSRLLTSGFGRPAPVDLLDRPSAGERTLVVEYAGTPVGTVRLSRDGQNAGVYGFVVDPAWQGRGIGRDVLRRVCQQLRDEGARQVGLEVEVDNERALGLYTSVGFVPVMTEDYFALKAAS